MGSDAQGKQLYNYQQILHSGDNMHFHTLMAGLFLFAPLAQADTLTVKNDKGEPMARVMVTWSANSSTPPTGRPWAMRVTRTPVGLRVLAR